MDLVLSNQDLVTNILLKLEIQDLGQCLLVKRAWHRIIKSKPFIGSHLKQTKKRCLLVKTGSRTGISNGFWFINEESLISDQKNEKTRISKMYLLESDDEKGISGLITKYNTIVGWSNGILCLYCYMDGSVTLWNPAINDAIAIPMLEMNSEKFIITTLYGFGFDAAINDYKVVGVQKMDNPLGNDFHVYSLTDGFWRRLAIADEQLVNGDMMIEGRGSTSTSGAYSWWLLDSTQQNPNPPRILSILISTEEMVVTILPAAIRSGLPEHANQLVNYNGCLGLINHVVNINEHHIWVLGELGHEQSWTRLFKIRTLHPPESTELLVSIVFSTIGPVITAFCKDTGVFLGRESEEGIGLGGYFLEGNTISQLILIDRETEQTTLVNDFGPHSIYQLCTGFNMSMVSLSHL